MLKWHWLWNKTLNILCLGTHSVMTLCCKCCFCQHCSSSCWFIIKPVLPMWINNSDQCVLYFLFTRAAIILNLKQKEEIPSKGPYGAHCNSLCLSVCLIVVVFFSRACPPGVSPGPVSLVLYMMQALLWIAHNVVSSSVSNLAVVSIRNVVTQDQPALAVGCRN